MELDWDDAVEDTTIVMALPVATDDAPAAAPLWRLAWTWAMARLRRRDRALN
jgi:hypothetical protein